MARSVSWRYMGAYTRHSWEKRAVWAVATLVSAVWMVRSALSPGSGLTVG